MDNTQTTSNNRQRTRSNSESDTGRLSSTLDANGMPIVDIVGVSSIPSNRYRSDTNLSQLRTVYYESPIGVGASTRLTNIDVDGREAQLMDEFDILTTKTNKWEEKINDGSLTIEEINRIYNNLRTDATQLCRAALCTNLNRITISEMRKS